MRWRSGLRFLVAIAPFVFPPLFCCFGMGFFAAYKSATGDGGRVTVAELRDPDRVPGDRTVTTESELILIGVEQGYLPGEGFPGPAEPLPDSAGAVFAFAAAPELLAYCPRECEALRAPGPRPLEGCLWDEGSVPGFGCEPELGVRSFVEAAAVSRGLTSEQMRVLMLGESSVHMNAFGASCTLLVGLGLVLFVALAFLRALTQARVGPPRFTKSAHWRLPLPPGAVAAKLRSLGLDQAAVLEEGEGYARLHQGHPETKARFLGLRQPADMARTVSLRWRPAEADPLGPAGVELEVHAEEALEWLRDLPEPLAGHSRASLDRSLEQLARALGAPPLQY